MHHLTRLLLRRSCRLIANGIDLLLFAPSEFSIPNDQFGIKQGCLYISGRGILVFGGNLVLFCADTGDSYFRSTSMTPLCWTEPSLPCPTKR